MKVGCLVLCCCLVTVAALAQDKKEENKDLPKVLVAVPLGIVTGKVVTVTLRGLKLDEATDVYLPTLRQPAKIIKKEKSGPPGQQDVARVGDTQLVVEFELPEVEVDRVPLLVTTAKGSSYVHWVFVDKSAVLVAKPGTHHGFKQALAVSLPTVVDGLLTNNPGVDTYRFEGQAGQRIRVEVMAARCGSGLDAILTLYDTTGNVLAIQDDQPTSMDPVLVVSLPRDGAYFLTVQDAHDQGGPAHVYRLLLKSS